MGPNEQNQHFTDVRKKVGIHIQNLVLLRGLPSLDGKHKLFVTKRGKTVNQAWVRQLDYNITGRLIDAVPRGLRIQTYTIMCANIEKGSISLAQQLSAKVFQAKMQIFFNFEIWKQTPRIYSYILFWNTLNPCVKMNAKYNKEHQPKLQGNNGIVSPIRYKIASM